MNDSSEKEPKMFTHYMCCLDCGNVVTLLEQETVEMWPNGYPAAQFKHKCSEDQKGQGTTAPRIIPGGPMDREQALARIPFGKLGWPR